MIATIPERRCAVKTKAIATLLLLLALPALAEPFVSPTHGRTEHSYERFALQQDRTILRLYVFSADQGIPQRAEESLSELLLLSSAPLYFIEQEAIYEVDATGARVGLKGYNLSIAEPYTDRRGQRTVRRWLLERYTCGIAGSVPDKTHPTDADCGGSYLSARTFAAADMQALYVWGDAARGATLEGVKAAAATDSTAKVAQRVKMPSR